MAGQSIDCKDDNIDFKKLEDQFANALASDEKYQRENNAKFRAIHQKVGTYDEFRDIVLASHLKPLEKNDKKGGMTYQTWNTAASGAGTVGKESIGCSKKKHITSKWDIPTTSDGFDKIWKRSCKTSKEKYEFLIAVGHEKIRQLLTTDCPLGEIIIALNTSLVLPEEVEVILGILEALTFTKRFSLALDFLENNEKNVLSELLEKCRNSLKHSNNLLSQKCEGLFETYGVKNP